MQTSGAELFHSTLTSYSWKCCFIHRQEALRPRGLVRKSGRRLFHVSDDFCMTRHKALLSGVVGLPSISPQDSLCSLNIHLLQYFDII